MAATNVPDDVSSSSQSQTDILLSKSLSSASSLVLLQAFSRLFTFVLNQALVRLVSPQVFGTAAIQFELLLSTILFLSREGIRSAMLRAPAQSSSRKGSQALVANISVLSIILGIPAAVVLSTLYVKVASAATTSQPHFLPSVIIYALGASIELLSEPLYIRAQNELRVDLRVNAEGAAVVAKAITTFIVLILGSSDVALPAFALGQAAYGAAVFLVYARAYREHIQVWPHKVTTLVHDNTSVQYFDPQLLQLSAAMTGQSLVKHFLTEGDKFLVSRLSPLADQGGYAVASNYGSLVARIVFQPVEETTRVFVTKVLAAPSSSSKASLEMASRALSAILLLFTHLLLLLVTFGPPYMPLALSLVLPPRFRNTSAPTILRAYVYYIPTMAFNGILEAFVASVSVASDLHAQSRWMFVFSLGFIGAAVGLAKGAGLGDVGLVWANVANLLCRALYAWLFVRRFFQWKGYPELVSWSKAVPPTAVLASFGVSAILTRLSEQRMKDVPVSLTEQVGHIVLGVCCLAGCLVICTISEHRMVTEAMSLLRRRSR